MKFVKEKSIDPNKRYIHWPFATNQDEQWLECSIEEYQFYNRPIWKLQKIQKIWGQCCVTQYNWWRCPGDCNNCKFHSYGVVRSIDSLVSTSIDTDFSMGDILPDSVIDTEFAVVLKVTLCEFFNSLMDADKLIYYYFVQGFTEEEIAKKLGHPKSTIGCRKRQMLAKLRELYRDK